MVDSIKKQPAAHGFHRDKIQELAGALLTHVQPLLNRDRGQHQHVSAATMGGLLLRDLEPVAETAWDLSAKILSSRLTFDFRFPEVGNRFSHQSMLPIWPDLEPTELQAKHWRIALVTTPVVTCRNDTGTNISAHSVSMADVYCMQ